jgi:thiamine-monophosphate kinase
MPSARTATLASLGETRLIQAIQDWLGSANPPPPHGIGDDCAVLPPRRARQLVTVDPVIAGRHFDDTVPAAAVAAKLLKRNLSDIASMGGRPHSAVIALAAPPTLPVAWLRGFYRGLADCARGYDVHIVGGDCAQTSGPFSAFLTLFGDAPARPLTRTGARPGDLIFVTGSLGGSILGKHTAFRPRLDEGRWLAGRREVHAAIDLSDGLGKDLPALIPDGCEGMIDPRTLPVSAAARKLSRRTHRDPLDCVLNDGEDYELLFAVAPRGVEDFIVAWHRAHATPLSCIGRILHNASDEPGGRALRFEPVLPAGVITQGYEHFR